MVSLLLVAVPSWAYAIGGISNTKVTVLSADTVALGAFEFEPGLQVSYPVNGSPRSADAGYRLTSGLNDALEAGLSYTAGAAVSDIAYGLKWRCVEEMHTKVALLVGINQSTSGTGSLASSTVGAVLTTGDDHAALDMDAIYEQSTGRWSGNVGYGIYVAPALQLIAEGNFDGQQLRLTPGLTWQAKDNVVVIAGLGMALSGSTDHVMNMAFTFSI